MKISDLSVFTPTVQFDPSVSKISYITDVEGNLNYWEKYLQISEVFHKNLATNQLELKPNWSVVRVLDSN